MIRPFKIISVSSNTEYKIDDHRGNQIGVLKNHEHFFDKLLSYSITAFGYELGLYVSDGYKNINPKFDRHDIIRALDFWIEYWVYQNKCDYILENTVNKDFELTVRELIETREAVLKCPADTQFVRNKIRPEGFSFDREYYLQYVGIPTKKPPKNKKMVEFTENVVDSSNSSVSTVDQFCYKVVKMTYKEYMNRGVLHLPNTTQADIDQLSRSFASAGAIIAHNFTENFRDVSRRFDFGTALMGRIAQTNTALDVEENTIEDEVSVPVRGGRHSDPNLWAAVRGRNGVGWKVVDTNNTTIADNFGTSTQAQDYINEHILPSEVTPRPLQMGEWVIWDTNRFRRATRDDSPVERIRLGTEPPHPSIIEGFLLPPINIEEARSFTVQDDESDIITYDNMSSVDVGQPIMTDTTNSFITIPVVYSGNGADISMDIFMESGRMIDQITSWTNHRIQIRPKNQRNNFLEIDGQEYHTTNVSISHNPRQPFSMHLRDLWIESTEATASSTGTTLEINFLCTMGLTRMTVSLTLHEPRGGSLMRQSIDSDQARAWDLEILGNNQVRIGGDQYTVLEPIQITMR